MAEWVLFVLACGLLLAVADAVLPEKHGGEAARFVLGALFAHALLSRVAVWLGGIV